MQTWIYCFFLLVYLGHEQWWANLHCLPLCRKKGQSQIYELVRSGIKGMEVRLGQSKIRNWESQGGNDGSKRWCGSLSSSSELLHHPFSFGHWIITREEVKGVNYRQGLEGIHSHLKWQELVGFNFNCCEKYVKLYTSFYLNSNLPFLKASQNLLLERI